MNFNDYQSQQELSELLPTLVVKAMNCGLTTTARKLDDAVKEIGWNIARVRELKEQNNE